MRVFISAYGLFFNLIDRYKIDYRIIYLIQIVIILILIYFIYRIIIRALTVLVFNSNLEGKIKKYIFKFHKNDFLKLVTNKQCDPGYISTLISNPDFFSNLSKRELKRTNLLLIEEIQKIQQEKQNPKYQNSENIDLNALKRENESLIWQLKELTKTVNEKYLKLQTLSKENENNKLTINDLKNIISRYKRDENELEKEMQRIQLLINEKDKLSEEIIMLKQKLSLAQKDPDKVAKNEHMKSLEKIEELKAEISLLKDKLNDSVNDKALSKQEIINLNSIKDKMLEEVNLLMEKGLLNDKFKKLINELESQIKNLETENQIIMAEANSNIVQESKLKGTINENRDLKLELTGLENEREHLLKKIDALRNENEGILDEANTLLIKKKSPKKLEKENLDLKHSIAEKENTIKLQERDLEEMSNEVTRLMLISQENSKLRKDLKTTKEENEKFMNEVNVLMEKLNKAGEKGSGKDAETIKRLSREKDDLLLKIEEQKLKIRNQNNEISQITSEVEDIMKMTKENKSLKQEIKKLKTENENLREKSSDINKISELEKELEQKDKEIEEMFKEVNLLTEQMQKG